jgi:hypothetical protein
VSMFSSTILIIICLMIYLCFKDKTLYLSNRNDEQYVNINTESINTKLYGTNINLP